MITKTELEQVMSQCYSSEHIYKTMIPNIFYTDGVKTFCENAEAWWFLTDVLAYSSEFINKDDFFSVKLSVDSDEKYSINIDDGNGKTYKELKGQTDCPQGDWTFFIERDTVGFIILWCQEH